MKITVAVSVGFAVLGCFLAPGCGGEEFVEGAGSGGASSDAGDSSAGKDGGLGGAAGKDGGGGAAGKEWDAGSSQGGSDAGADASACQPTQDVASFKLTETVENSLPTSIEGWSQAACSGIFDYTCPAGYTRTRCELGDLGSHGGCSNCAMALVACECL